MENYFYPTAASAFIAECFAFFDRQPDNIPFKLSQLSDATYYTIRGIEKKFRQHLGLASKQAFAILKIRKVVNELIVPDRVSPTSLAYQYGYTDQAHFTKSYRFDDLAKAIGISRIQLYRKVKALLDCSITDYILSRRLKKAQYPLRQEDHSISEISYMVGISSPTYFSTLFKNRYGISPSEYKKG